MSIKSTQTIVTQKLKLEYNTGQPEDEWINSAYLNEPTSKLYLLLKKLVIVINVNDGKEIKRFKNKSNKFITKITSYNPFYYDIIGLADGSIQVRNSNDDLLHVFSNHSNKITGLEIVPGKPSFLSSSLDGSIGLFNLVNFQEIYRLYLKEPCLGLSIIDENQFISYSERELNLWNFNNITDCFTSLKSPPLHLEFSKNFNCPNRVLCQTLDGGIRLISPVTGEIITTAIPYIDSDLIMSVLYSPALKKENITCAKLYEDFLVPGKALTGFSFLICGTNNGGIIFLGEYGMTKFKYMAHLNEVTCLFVNTSKKYVISGAKDYTINVTEFDFNLKKMIKSSITITTSFIPCLISNINNIICASSDDCSIHTIEFDVDKKESKEIINHDKMDDHSDLVRAICPINRLELFATVGQDKSLKIWDYDNCLIKEIHFTDPMCAICCIENTLDLLIGVSDRVDILRYTEYLPSGIATLVQVLNKYYSSPLEYEEPLPFSDDINILRKVIPAESPKYYDISAFEIKKENIFSDINLCNAYKKMAHKLNEMKDHLEDIDNLMMTPKEDMRSYFSFSNICESLEKYNVTSVVKLDEDNELSSVFCEPEELEGFAHLRNLGLIRDSYSVLNLNEDKDIIFFNSFNDLSIMTLKKKTNEIDKQIEMETIQEQIDSAINYSQIIASNALRRISTTKLNGVQDLIFIEEYQKYSKYKSFLGKEDDFETNLKKPVLYLNPTSPNQSLFLEFNSDETEFSYSNYEKQIKEFTHLLDDDTDQNKNDIKDNNKNENENENENKIDNKNENGDDAAIENNDKQNKKKVEKKITLILKPTIPIAPDGYIPNSIILKVIHEWRNNHPNFIVNDFGEFPSHGAEFDLIREFDRKINDINNIKNENELIREIIEKFRERKNIKKLEEMEQMKRNNIKLHTELSSFLQFSNNNRFLNKYFNGIMPSIYDNDEKEKEEEEEERKRKEQEEEEERKRKEQEEEARKLSQLKKESTKTNTISSESSASNKVELNDGNNNPSIKSLEDDIDIQDNTEMENVTNISEEKTEEETYHNYEETEDESEDNIDSDGNNKYILDNINEDEEYENNNENDYENNGSLSDMDKTEIEENKKYLYYSEDDIPEEIQRLLDTFWFSKEMMEECSQAKILPKIFDIFNKSKDELAKFDIVNYLKYYNNFKTENDNDYTSDEITNFLCDYLKTRWNEELDEDEISKKKNSDNKSNYTINNSNQSISSSFDCTSNNCLNESNASQDLQHNIENTNDAESDNKEKEKNNEDIKVMNSTTNIYEDENYIPQPIPQICDKISELLQSILKKFLLYIKIQARFKDTIKNIEISPLHVMQKKYNNLLEKEIKNELKTNPKYTPDNSNFEFSRMPIAIMINPTSFDYVPSIIHYLKQESLYLMKKANEQRILMEKMKKKEMDRQKELERREYYNKCLEEKERKYKERLEQRRRKALNSAEQKKSENQLQLPSIPKNRNKYNIKSEARYGNTHCSKCHPSRETICYPLHQIPEGSICERCLRHLNHVDYHFKKMYKSIPYEVINPAPFIESNDERMNNRINDIQRSILEAMEKSKDQQGNKKLYSKLGILNKFVNNHQQQSRDLLRDINLQKKRITNQILLENQKQQKYNNMPIHKFNTTNPLNDDDMKFLTPVIPPARSATNMNQQALHHLPSSTNKSEYWTSKTYFIPMYSYLQNQDNNSSHYYGQ
ncbi:WD40 repeat-like protein [Neocallimastix lanati (nom. inval.)]|nr:WD40 repeat-like protein [Neocallimastix sp. JGI-2020a]